MALKKVFRTDKICVRSHWKLSLWIICAYKNACPLSQISNGHSLGISYFKKKDGRTEKICPIETLKFSIKTTAQKVYTTNFRTFASNVNTHIFYSPTFFDTFCTEFIPSFNAYRVSSQLWEQFQMAFWISCFQHTNNNS